MRVVTIDGPAGAGKSTVARMLADRLGWRYLDTGAMYRAVTLGAQRRGLDLADAALIARLAGTVRVELRPEGTHLDGEDVSAVIRSPEVTAAVRYVAGNPAARAVLVDDQRAFASVYDTVTEGRDQGTVVFPNALRKFFLVASLEERARRRHAELIARGRTVDLETVLEDIRRRDADDEARSVGPLVPAQDAIHVDTTGLSVAEVVSRLWAEVPRDDHQ